LLGGSFTLIGDAYENIIDSPVAGGMAATFSPLVATACGWLERAGAGLLRPAGALRRGATGGGFADRVNTFDIQAQHSFTIGKAQQIVWGAGYRSWKDEFTIRRTRSFWSAEPDGSASATSSRRTR
jgi:hypothetical protein